MLDMKELKRLETIDDEEFEKLAEHSLHCRRSPSDCEMCFKYGFAKTSRERQNEKLHFTVARLTSLLKKTGYQEDWESHPMKFSDFQRGQFSVLEYIKRQVRG